MFVRLVFLFYLIGSSHLWGASLIDARFKLSRELSQSAKTPNLVGNLYKGFFAQSMYSRCRWYPSDSQYLQIKSWRCGQVRGILNAYGRFSTEFDVNQVTAAIVNDQDYIRFLDFGETCETF